MSSDRMDRYVGIRSRRGLTMSYSVTCFVDGAPVGTARVMGSKESLHVAPREKTLSVANGGRIYLMLDSQTANNLDAAWTDQQSRIELVASSGRRYRFLCAAVDNTIAVGELIVCARSDRSGRSL